LKDKIICQGRNTVIAKMLTLEIFVYQVFK